MSPGRPRLRLTAQSGLCRAPLPRRAGQSSGSEPVREFRDFLQIDTGIGHLHWLMQHNGGVFLPPWGKIEQWLLSVPHDDADVDRFAANFARLANAVAI